MMNVPPQQPKSIAPDVISAKILEEQEERVRRTEALVATIDSEYAFQALITYLQWYRMTDVCTEAEYGQIPALVELAAFHLYPRFGEGGSRDPGQVQEAIDALTEQNRFRGLATAFSVDRGDIELASLQVQLRLYAESVRGNAYPPQTRRQIEKIQGHFEGWFQYNAGIGPLRVLAILDAYETTVNENLQSHSKKLQGILTEMGTLAENSGKISEVATGKEIEGQRISLVEEFPKFNDEMSLVFSASFEQIARLVPGVTLKEWDAMRALIGLTSESRKMIYQPRDVKDRPLYFFSNNRFSFIDISSVYDAIFEVFDRLTRNYQSFRNRRYIPNLKQWTECAVVECLHRFFPSNAVFRELTYPDPNNPGGETELDAAVIWGPFLVLVEVKGKQFQPRSRIGDPCKLRDDLKNNIEEAFEQAQRAMQFVEENKTATFVEKGTGRKLVLHKGTLHRIYPVSVTLHHFGGLATQLALLKRIGLFKDSAYPWSVSLADLDIITKFAGSPDVFLHYIQRRLDLQRSEKHILGDELDVFGIYLENRLHPSQYWERKAEDGQDFTMLMLTGGQKIFDEWFQAEQGVRKDYPDIRLNLPPKFLEIISELRRRNDDGARRIAFALLSLSQDAVLNIEKIIYDLKRKARPDGRFLRVTIKDSGLVVSILVAMGMEIKDLRRHTIFRAKIEKYRLKATASVALGINADDASKSFEFAFWVEGPWEQNPLLETALEKERSQVLPGQKLPGPNKPCFCGSGKKFKKCCRDKITISSN